MKKYLFIAIVALATLVSCQKELLENGKSDNEHIIFSASIGQNDTKATIDDSTDPAKIKWESTDKITITDGSGHVAVYALTAGAGETSATFEYESGETLDVTGTYSGVFGLDPSCPQLYNGTAIPIHMTAPSTSDNNKLFFTADCGVLKLTLTDADDDVMRIEVIGSTQTYVMNATSPVSITSGKDFYVVLPAGAYSAVKVYNNTGKVATKSKSITIIGNHVQPVSSTSLDFVDGTKGITSGHPWVQLWTDGPKWAEFNIGSIIVDYFHLATTSSDKATYKNSSNVDLDCDVRYSTENCGGLYSRRNSAFNGRVNPWGEMNGIGSDESGWPADNYYDIATKLWGLNWRTPSLADFRNLYTETDCIYYSGADGDQYVTGCTLPGFELRGKTASEFERNSIFIPACGYLYGYPDQGYQDKITERARLWCDEPSSTHYTFRPGPSSEDGSVEYSFGLSVRAIFAPAYAFSVSNSKKVLFSKGNLQAKYNGTSYAMGFATNQYSIIGDAAGNTTIDAQNSGKVVDLFGWSTDATNNNWGIHTAGSATATYTDGDFKDWGLNVGDGSTWRTLTSDEWTYLLSTRGTGDTYFKYGVTVCGNNNCLVIAPDGNTTAIASSYDAASWATAETNGFVCLPAAGFRSGSYISNVGYYGHYWSSTKKDDVNSYRVYFISDNLYLDGDDYRYTGDSVRLVTDAE